MKQELEQQIYEIDPVFFRQKDLDMTQTCMCWGIECGDGWFEPIREFVTKVRMLNDMLKPFNTCLVAEQIKSKWADFTCYWNIDVLDDTKNVELTEEQQDMVDFAHSIMDDLVRGCVEKCSHTCELCGKHSFWDDEVFACGSWLTVKCLDCAQREQRVAGKVTRFREGFQFLSPFVKEPIVIDGLCYHTIIGAYYATLHPQYHGVFLEMKSPSEVQAVAVNLGLCRDDDEAFEAMRKVLEIRYGKKGKPREGLLSTRGMDIVQLNNSHENVWGSCWCKACAGKGQNRYGKMLMEIRDRILAEEGE